MGAARDVPVGSFWGFREHRTMAEVMAGFDAVADQIEDGLLPCPFCGRKEELAYQIINTRGSQRFCIICYGCDCEGPSVIGENLSEIRKAAIEAWNRRG